MDFDPWPDLWEQVGEQVEEREAKSPKAHKGLVKAGSPQRAQNPQTGVEHRVFRADFASPIGGYMERFIL